MEEMKEAMKERSYFEKWRDAFAYHKFRKQLEVIEAEREAEAELQPEAENKSIAFDWRDENEIWIEKMKNRKRPDLN